MKPADLRNANWTEVQQHVTEDMRRVHAAWRDHGPGTTRQIAAKSGISLLTLRPRTTDLYQLGMVECTSRTGNEGIYEYRTEAQAQSAEAWREDRQSHTQGKRATVGTPPVFTSRAAMVAWAASIMGREARIKRRRAVPEEGRQLDLLTV